MSDFKSEIRDGMRIDWDVPITADDGLVLRADVYRPIAEGPYPYAIRVAGIAYIDPKPKITASRKDAKHAKNARLLHGTAHHRRAFPGR
jgi:predicted acyl esterase